MAFWCEVILSLLVYINKSDILDLSTQHELCNDPRIMPLENPAAATHTCHLLAENGHRSTNMFQKKMIATKSLLLD